MARLRPAYLIHGDEHGAIARRRARLCALGDDVELVEGDGEAVAAALAALTLGLGRRIVVVDGAERLTESDVQRHVAPALGALAPDTTVAFFAREDGRRRAPAALHAAVEAAGGQVAAEQARKPWELPAWTRERGERLGVRLDTQAAREIVAAAGARQESVLRELEKLALAADELPVTVTAQELRERGVQALERRAFELADALTAGDSPRVTALYVSLREQGERLPGLVHIAASRLRDALDISRRLADGESPAAVRRTLRMPPRAAERLVADVARRDPDDLAQALGGLADLELDSRGGGAVRARRSARAALHEDTQALLALTRR